MAMSSAVSRSAAHFASSSTPAVLSIGRSPEAAIAPAISLRRLAQRLRETFACMGTTPSSVLRMAAKSIGIAAGASPTILA